MLVFFIAVIKIIIILGLLVFIHEGGHFLVAKLCKIKVNEFAIGFGPTIWKKQGKETKYALRLIPLGGFVSMEGEEERSEQEGSFSKASIPKRIAVVAAGGSVNIIFALIVYFILTSFTGNNISTIVENTIPNTDAQTVGIQANDEIVKVNGKRIHYKNDLSNVLENCNGNKLEIVIRRNGEEQTYTINPLEEKYNYTGIAVSNGGEEATKVAALYPNSPSVQNGLEVNDIIISINGIDVRNDVSKLATQINEKIGEPMELIVERGKLQEKITITPEVRSNYYLGVYMKMAENNFSNNVYYAFWETGNFAFSIVDNLKLLFTGNVTIDQMMGPVGIGGVVAETNGIADFISILALVSISLGFTNLLPFPPLDGGKIVILLLEAIRRKPLKEQTELTIQFIGFSILIGLSILITYNDILRVF